MQYHVVPRPYLHQPQPTGARRRHTKTITLKAFCGQDVTPEGLPIETFRQQPEAPWDGDEWCPPCVSAINRGDFPEPEPTEGELSQVALTMVSPAAPAKDPEPPAAEPTGTQVDPAQGVAPGPEHFTPSAPAPASPPGPDEHGQLP